MPASSGYSQPTAYCFAQLKQRTCLIRLNCLKIQEKTENKKTLKNLKKPLAIPKNYAIISLACEGNENKETKQATIK